MDDNKKKKLLELEKEAPSFAKTISPFYKLLSWKWGNTVPDEKEIHVHILRLIKDLINGERDTGFISCGGIVIKYNPNAEDWELYFQLWSGFLKLREKMERGL